MSVAYNAIPDPVERIRIVLRSVPRGSEPHGVPVTGSAAPHEMVPTVMDAAKSLALAGQAALFAAFGFIVLRFGRDRASLWLGMTCAALAPDLVTLYGFVPEPLMLVCRIAADMLRYVAFYGLFAMAATVADEALRKRDPLRRALAVVRVAVIVLIAAAAANDLGQLLLPVVRGETLWPSLVHAGNLASTLCWCLDFCLLPLVVLAVAALRASSSEQRKRARVIFITTLVGLSGVVFSIVTELLRVPPAPPHFDTLWFTLLLIPVGFIVVIREFGVITVRVVINRLLIVSVITFLLTKGFDQPESLLHAAIDHWLKPKNAGEQHQFYAVVDYFRNFVVVYIFGAVHHRVEAGIEHFVLRSRDRALERLSEYCTTEPPTFTDIAKLWDRTAAAVCEILKTHAAAVYDVRDGGFALAAASGPWDRTMTVSEDDPRFDPKNAAKAGIYLFHIDVGTIVLGVLAVYERFSAVDPKLDEKEIAALKELARTTAETALSLRLRELTEFVADVAAGPVAEESARSRAIVLRGEALHSVRVHAPQNASLGDGFFLR